MQFLISRSRAFFARLSLQATLFLRQRPTGAHVIKLESYSREAVMTLEEARPQLEAKLKTPYQDKKTREWEQGLKKGAAIEIVEPAMLN